MHRQLAAELPPDGESRRLVLSASKEIELGSRAMLLLAEGLFRLDVSVSPDTLRTVVRNLSDGPLEFAGAPGEDRVIAIAFGEAASYRPSNTKLEFALGSGTDRISASVLIGTLHLRQRGMVRVTAQAVVCQVPSS